MTVQSIVVSRRKFLESTAAAASLTASGLGALGLAVPRQSFAQTKLSPEEALKELMDGNKRFTSGKTKSREHELEEVKRTAEKQEPFASVLSCADSRVPVELVFDQTFGQVFGTRVAGNVATPEIIASLEYGVAVLGTKALMVLGHANCGAVKAAIQGKEVPGQISTLFSLLRPAIDQAGSDLEASCKANAKIQASLLGKASPVLAGLVKDKKLKIVAGYYNLSDGHVDILE